jgi:hypothetical protein
MDIRQYMEHPQKKIKMTNQLGNDHVSQNEAKTAMVQTNNEEPMATETVHSSLLIRILKQYSNRIPTSLSVSAPLMWL